MSKSIPKFHGGDLPPPRAEFSIRWFVVVKVVKSLMKKSNFDFEKDGKNQFQSVVCKDTVEGEGKIPGVGTRGFRERNPGVIWILFIRRRLRNPKNNKKSVPLLP